MPFVERAIMIGEMGGTKWERAPISVHLAPFVRRYETVVTVGYTSRGRITNREEVQDFTYVE